MSIISNQTQLHSWYEIVKLISEDPASRVKFINNPKPWLLKQDLIDPNQFVEIRPHIDDNGSVHQNRLSVVIYSADKLTETDVLEIPLPKELEPFFRKLPGFDSQSDGGSKPCSIPGGCSTI